MAFRLGSAASAAGYRLAAFDTLGSTNEEALARARAGESGPLWIAARHQTAGRGRRGRSWETPEGNLAASLLMPVPGEPHLAATLGFAAGLALEEALASAVPQLRVRVGLDASESSADASRRIRLKWPNDLLLDGGKIAGILLEGTSSGPGRNAVVIGFGVNVVGVPADHLPYPAVSLAEYGCALTAEDLFERLSDAWLMLESLWDGGLGFDRIRQRWLARAAGLGAPIAVRNGENVYKGIFETIDEQGRLVVHGEDGTRRLVAAGDVHFSAAATVH